MKRDDVIRLAWEAGMTGLESGGILENFERFAALVAAEKEKQILDILERLQERVGDAHNYYTYAAKVIRGEI